MYRRPSGRSSCAVFVLLAALVLSACGGSKTAAPPDTSTTTVAAPTTETVILDAYRSYWDAFAAASNPMNPDDPRLAENATDKALAQLRNSFLAYKSAGTTFRGGVELSPKVTTSSSETAIVDDCYLDHGIAYDSNGAAQGAESGVREHIEATMVLRDSRWKVAAISHKGSGCAPS